MANREVNLTKRVKTPHGYRYFPAVYAANGRVRPNVVRISETENQTFLDGSYYIEWREGAKRIRLAVGKDSIQAGVKRQRKESELNAVNNGVAVLPDTPNGRKAVSAAVFDYLEEVRLGKKPKTLAAYTKSLEYFQNSCRKIYLDEIERRDLIRFSAYLRDEMEQAPRTIWNKFANVVSFLKGYGVTRLAKKEDWPRYTEEEPDVYEKGELKKLFAACDAEERLWFEFFLMTGEREQEVMNSYWTDVNFSSCTVRVTHKPERGWTPKAYKEREIPVPKKLIKSLKTAKKKSAGDCQLLFPTAGCNPKLDFLDCLKTVAERAKLDKDNFRLHKFRATFATWSLWAGVDLRTVQLWLGHADMESTMRYLKPARSKLVNKKVNAIFR